MKKWPEPVEVSDPDKLSLYYMTNFPGIFNKTLIEAANKEKESQIRNKQLYAVSSGESRCKSSATVSKKTGLVSRWSRTNEKEKD